MGALRALQFIGITAKIIGGAATAGIGCIELKSFLNERPAIGMNDDPEVSLNIDLTDGDFEEVTTTEF